MLNHLAALCGPDTSLIFHHAGHLLMVVIGGMARFTGAIIGATIFILAQNYLQALMGAASNATAEAGIPLLPGLAASGSLAAVARAAVIASVYSFPPASWDGCEAPGARRLEGVGRQAAPALDLGFSTRSDRLPASPCAGHASSSRVPQWNSTRSAELLPSLI